MQIGGELTEATKEFIDRQTENYMNLFKKSHGIRAHSKTRRSLPIDDMNSLTADEYGKCLYFIHVKKWHFSVVAFGKNCDI